MNLIASSSEFCRNISGKKFCIASSHINITIFLICKTIQNTYKLAKYQHTFQLNQPSHI